MVDPQKRDLFERARRFLEETKSEEIPELIKEKIDPKREKQKGRNILFWALLFILLCQLVVMNIVLFSVGYGCMTLSQPTLSVFIVGVFGQVAGFVIIILKFYFKD